MGFESVSAADPSQCDHGTLEGDNIELWLIRCPPGFQASELHDRTIDVSQGLSMIGEGSQATGYCLRPIPACESAGVVGVFPSARHKRWLLGKPLTRQFAVTLAPQTLVAASSEGPRPLPPVARVEGLCMRNALPGVTHPPVAPKVLESGKRARPKKSEAEAGDEPSKKKKKKKHKA